MFYFLAALCLSCVAFLAFDLAKSFVLARTRKIGGLYFFAFRRIRVSFCLAKLSAK